MNKKRFVKAYVREVDAEKGKLIGAVGSTDAVDRYGEIIDQASWDLKNFKKNPVMLWAHNLSFGEDRPPIGKLTKIKIEDGKLLFDAQFDMEDPFAADIFRKYKEGFLNAFSVGFIPHTIQRYDEAGQPLDSIVLHDNELLEMSAVPVPANPEALQSLRSRSFAVRDWTKMLDEAEQNDKDHDEAVDPPKKKDDKPADPPAAPADPNPADPAVPADTTISDDTTAAGKPTEVKGGGGSSPKKTQVGMTPKTVRILREATRLLQSALTEVNASRK